MPRLKGRANREPAGTIYEDKIAKKPPQCRFMPCSKDYRSTRCCYFCRRKYACSWPCMNHPLECGATVIPRRREPRRKGDDADETD